MVILFRKYWQLMVIETNNIRKTKFGDSIKKVGQCYVLDAVHVCMYQRVSPYRTRQHIVLVF